MKQKKIHIGRVLASYFRQPNTYIIVDLLTIMISFLLFSPRTELLIRSYVAVILVLQLLLFVVIVFSDRFKMFRESNYPLAMIVCYAGILLAPLNIGHQTLFNRYLVVTFPTVFFFVFFYNLKYRGNKANIILSLVILLIMINPSWNTYNALLRDAGACRKMGIDEEYTYIQMMRGVMGYVLVYSVVFIHIVFAFLVKNNSRLDFSKTTKVLIILVCVFSFFFIVLSNYFTALILAVFADFAIWVLAKSSKYVILLITLFTIYSFNPDGFNDVIIDTSLRLVPHGKTYDRIESMKTTSLDAMDSRKGHMSISWRTINHYPITGGVVDKLFTINGGISQHSYVLDTIAIYGLPLGVFYFYIALFPFIFLYKKAKYYTQKFFVSLMGGVFFVFCYRNNYTGHIGCIVYLIVPTACTYVNTYFKPLVHKNTYIDLSKA